jgi:hypothetical protein
MKSLTETVLLALQRHLALGTKLEDIRVDVFELTRWLKRTSKTKKDLAVILNLYHRCPTHEEIDLKWTSHLTDTVLTKIAKDSPLTRLKTMNLTGHSSLSGMTFTVATFPHLISLQLSECRNINEEIVFSITKSCPSLTTLSLGKNLKISNLSHLQTLPSLTSLDLHDCRRLSNHGLVSIATHFPGLASLDISGCYANGNGGVSNEGIVYVVTKCPILHLNLANCRNVTNDILPVIAKSLPHLESIHLTNMTSLAKESLSLLVNLCKNIRTLIVGGCHRIGDEVIIEVAEHLLNLEELDVSR